MVKTTAPPLLCVRPMRIVRWVALLFILLCVKSARAAYETSSTEWDGLADCIQLAKDEAGPAGET